MSKINKQNILKSINKLSKGKVLVVGDLILDEFIEGSPERISREAPVLILEHQENSFALGGASNAANNIRALGSKCLLLGVVGNDSYMKDFKAECKKNKITPLLITDSKRHTTVKTRIISMAHKHPTSSILFKQQVLRLDRLTRGDVSRSVESRIISSIKKNIRSIKAILISDYDLGVCTSKVIESTLRIAKEKNIPTIIDAQSDLERFKGAFLFTPNQPDTEAAVGFSITNNSSLIKAGKKLLKQTEAEHILITRGSEGMALFSSSSPDKPYILPAFNVSEVFDVTGAGDTVAGAIASALSTGSSIKDACILGNLAASLVVRKYGTVTATPEELKQTIKTLG